VPEVSTATIWRVDPAGGNVITIARGLFLAQLGDTVLVPPGTYREHDLQLSPGVSLIGELGRDSTIIDAQGFGDGVIGADGAVVRGFTIVHANRAAYCDQTSPGFFDNRFREGNGWAIFLYHSTSEIAGNEFFAYVPSYSSLIVSNQSTPRIHDNLFHGEDPNGNISAIDLSDVEPGGIGAARIERNTIYGRIMISSLRRSDTTRVRENLIVSGNGYSEALNIASSTGPLLIENNTIVGGYGIFLQGDSRAVILRNIVMDAQFGIEAWGGEVLADCNDVFRCRTSYSGTSPGSNDFSANPLFCDPTAGDYHLSTFSPCASTLAPLGCGLVGALDATCVIERDTIEVRLDLEPGTVNLASGGRWVTAFLEPSSPVGAGEIEAWSVRLSGTAPVDEPPARLGDHDEDGVLDLRVTFDRGAFVPPLVPGFRTLEVSGELKSGDLLRGAAEIQVIDPTDHGIVSVSPNPLRRSGVLRFQTTTPGPIAVQVFDLRGRLLRTLYESPSMPAGRHEIPILEKREGELLGSGVYFVRIQTQNQSRTRRFVVLR